MTSSRRAFVISGATVAAAAALPAPARAQAWPTQPVRVIVTQAAGGTPDIICRMLTDRLSRALGQPFIVENRPGAGNVIGAQYVARATPDGNTLLWSTAAALVTNPLTVKNLPYDPVRDFITVARVAKGPFLVMANPSLAANNLPELMALAKAKPGQLSIATDGPRNFSGLVAAWLNKNAGVDIKPIPYAAMPTGVQDTISGRVQLAILAVPSAAPMIAGGLLKPIAVSSEQRVPGLDAIAPIADTIPGFDFYGWMAVSAPAGTPRDIVEKLNREIGKVLDDKDFADALVKIGFYSFGSHSQQAAEDSVRAEFALWKKVVAAIGVEPE